jgi:hypothetical protein
MQASRIATNKEEEASFFLLSSRAMRWIASQKTVIVRVNSGHDSIDGTLD